MVGHCELGVIRLGVRVGEELWDVVLMSILRQEWNSGNNDPPYKG